MAAKKKPSLSATPKPGPGAIGEVAGHGVQVANEPLPTAPEAGTEPATPTLATVGGTPVATPAATPAASPAATPAATSTVAPTPSPMPPVERDLSQFKNLIDLIDSGDEQSQRKEIGRHVRNILNKHGLASYTVVMLVDDVDAISRFHSDEIYKTTSAAMKQKDVLLIMSSDGGRVEPAYLLSKTCKRLSKSKFVVAIPRRAKSAATLIALGADEIHMGLMSELGPIDPQIDGFPALGIQNSLEVFADLTCKYPGSADLFARYLERSLDLKGLGYFARVPESAAQYAERLLTSKTLGEGQTPAKLSRHFVEHYKDHSFVIDVDEAKTLLGPMVKTESPEYAAANEVYQFLSMVDRCFTMIVERDVWYVGSVETGFSSRKRAKSHK